MQLCNKCDKRNTCVELCQRAEEFVAKDHICRREVLASELGILIEDTIIKPIVTIDPLTTKDWSALIKIVNLTPKQKRYLFLKFWQNKTYEEIANKYNTGKSNIHNIVMRAKEEISKYLKK